MAENETLDLRRSPRWNQARRLIREGASPDELALEVLRVLSLTLKKVAKLIPMGRLIEESLSPDGDPHALRPECRDAAEYEANICGFEHSLLAAFDARTADLLRIALHVYTIDRLIRRDRRSTWSYRPRELELAVPVSDIGFWRSHHVQGLIQGVLEFLSDDLWDIRFRRSEVRQEPLLPCLPLKEQIDDVFLFSGGLDSVAGAAAHLASTSRRQLAVTVLHNSLPRKTCFQLLQEVQSSSGRSIPWGRLSTSLVKPGRFDQQETTQRCRAFLFVAAGIAAALAKGAHRVLMFESGTGAINAPLMAGMATGGRTTKSSHPHFLRKMSELASLMCQRRISVELPYWQLTKGEMVKALADLGLQMGPACARVSRCRAALGRATHPTKH
jgi:hypothetical protein